MKPKPRWFLIFSSLFVLICLAVVGALLSFSIVVVTVRNDSGQTAKKISVTVQRKTLSFPDLRPGASARRWFFNSGADSHYTFQATLADGSVISIDEGYITSGFLVGHADFIIGPNGAISFSEEY